MSFTRFNNYLVIKNFIDQTVCFTETGGLKQKYLIKYSLKMSCFNLSWLIVKYSK